MMDRGGPPPRRGLRQGRPTNQSPRPMKYTFLVLILALMPLAACQSDRADAIDDRGDAIEDSYDDAANSVDDMIDEGAPLGDSADVLGDGEIIDEPSEPDANELGQ